MKLFLCAFLAMTASLASLSAAPTDAAPKPKTEYAYLGGGCFWCTEAAYELLPGVKAAVSGYAGGKTVNPTYEDVCTGDTGHAEVVRVEFDPAVVTYRQIVDFFWNIHDPTTLNSQGPDHGTQYRSIILTTSPEQKKIAEESMAAANPGWGGKIVTQIVPFTKFYEAEAYHQDYFKNNPGQGYCRAVIRPKIDKIKKHLADPAAH